MNDPLTVRIFQRAGQGQGYVHRLVDRQLLLAIEPGTQRLSLDIRHYVIEQSVRTTGVEQRQEVRVLQVGRDPNLGQESVCTEKSAELWSKNFQCDFAVVLQVPGQV